MLRALLPQASAPGAAGSTFSAAAFAADQPLDVPGTLLGFGPAALAVAAPPQPGDVVTLQERVDPPLDGILTALGGGPLLIKSGTPFDDPFAPAPEERERRFPVSGAATTADGELLLVAVDGRQPSVSIGLTRPEFAALMLALGATDGMAFDSGGSATIVARVLGDPHVSVLNSPSDGRERPVADGLYVYSEAPPGLNPRLVVRPDRVVALPGVEIPLFGAIVDDAGHFMRTGAARAAGRAAGRGCADGARQRARERLLGSARPARRRPRREAFGRRGTRESRSRRGGSRCARPRSPPTASRSTSATRFVGKPIEGRSDRRACCARRRKTPRSSRPPAASAPSTFCA